MIHQVADVPFGGTPDAGRPFAPRRLDEGGRGGIRRDRVGRRGSAWTGYLTLPAMPAMPDSPGVFAGRGQGSGPLIALGLGMARHAGLVGTSHGT
jgi:hypothetical protein